MGGEMHYTTLGWVAIGPGRGKNDVFKGKPQTRLPLLTGGLACSEVRNWKVEGERGVREGEISKK